MKKEYSKPEISVLSLTCVITASGMNGVSETCDNDVGNENIFANWWQEG